MVALTLATMRDEVEELLHDSSNVYWSADEVDRAIRSAFYEYAARVFYRAMDEISDSAGEREYAVTGLAGFHHMISLWWPYDSSDVQYPPPLAAYQMLDATHLQLMTRDEPDGTLELRAIYAAKHTLSGLDGATATTLDPVGEEVVILRAAGFCCLQMAAEAIVSITVTDRACEDWRALADIFLARADSLAAASQNEGGRTDGGWSV